MHKVNGHFLVKENDIYFDNWSLKNLVRKFGTPLFVFSEKRIIENIVEIRGTMDEYYKASRLFYALKANSNINLLKIFKQHGVFAEVVSHGEMLKALKAGYNYSEIVFNGPGKRLETLKISILNDIHCINIDSEYEYNLIKELSKKLNKRVNIGVRIVPEIGAQVIETGLSWTKFGLEIDPAISLLRDAHKSGLFKIRGIHGHLGSQILNLDTWKKGISTYLKIADTLYKEGIELEHINIGGGFPVDYSICPISLNIELSEKFIPKISHMDIIKEISKVIRQSKIRPFIYLELGRRLIADSGILLTQILNEKTRLNGEKWIILDVGFNLLLSSVLYRWYYPLLNLSKISDNHDSYFKVGGPLCDTDDVFHDLEGEKKGRPQLPMYRPLPKKTKVGDILIFFNTGAYTIEESSNYNSIPRPKMLLIKEDGNIVTIRERETIENLMERELNLKL